MNRTRHHYPLTLALLALACAANATDRIVPFQYSTIQLAINASSPGDRVLLQNRTFNERFSFNGKNIVVKAYEGDFPPTVDGGDGGPVVTFAGTEPPTAQLSGIIIQNGLASNGGGILGNFTLATIKNCTIRNNKANAQGGGIYGVSGLVQTCIIENNEAANGGGIAGSDGTLLQNTIRNNKTTGAGGGIYSCTNVIESNVITGNESTTQGGGAANCSTGTLRFNEISLNKAVTHGGGIHNSDIEIAGNIIVSNQVTAIGSQANPASFGAGIYNCNGPIWANQINFNVSNGTGGGIDKAAGAVFDNVIFGNAARTGGGVNEATGSLVNNTIWGNTAVFTIGGVRNSAAPVNCILWANSPGPQLANSGTPQYCCIQAWAGGGVGNITSVPQVVDAANGDFHLQSISPCIDTGGNSGISLDFEGDPRPTSFAAVAGGDGSRYDIGADEYVPPYVNLLPSWSIVTPKIKGEGLTLKYSVNGTLLVTNTGNIPAPAGAQVNFYISNNTSFDASDTTIGKTLLLKKPLAPDAGILLKLKGKLPKGVSASGKYLLGVADRTSIISEKIESDNTAVFGPLP